jgi:asparagine synthase (glutamine-hydrolysing)
MCGIFGIIRKHPLGDTDKVTLCGLADALIHRGPDGEGFHVEGSVGIGMRRLSIIDLAGGWQPIHSEDGSIVLVANGEIYNFVELRQMLEQRGHQFATHSDSETIIHLYEEHGEDCVHYLRGMYAFALLDRRRRRVIIARDRMGEKPLAIHETEDSVFFASEASALVYAGVVPFDMDPDGISDYFHWGFIPEPQTALRGVRKLGAGSLLAIDLDTWSKSERRYWNLADAPAVEGEPVGIIRSEIDRISELLVRSDVPIGIGLSSGIDSSAIASLAIRDSKQPVHAFTVGYQGSTWQDESAHARRYADRLGLEFHGVSVEVAEVVSGFGRVCASRDDPLADISGAGYHALMKLCHDSGVRVMLTGTGGDELFWGYAWHRKALTACIRKQRLLAGEAGMLDYLEVTKPPISISGGMSWVETGGGLLAGLDAWRRDRRTSPDRLVFWDSLPWREFTTTEARLRSLAGPELLRAKRPADAIFSRRELWNDLETSLTTLLCDSYLQCNGLVILDRQGMANSIEGRAPLVDYRLAELAVGLRKATSDWHLGHKGWLKAALSHLVPEEVMSMRKRGFTPPWRTWMRSIFDHYADDLRNGILVSSGILTPEAARELSNPFDALARPRHMAYPAMVLEQWARSLSSRRGTPVTVEHAKMRTTARR